MELEYRGNLMVYVAEKVLLAVIDGWAERAGQRRIRGAELRKMKILSFEKEFLGPDKNGRCNLAVLAVVSIALNEGTFHDYFQSGRSGPIAQPCWYKV